MKVVKVTAFLAVYTALLRGSASRLEIEMGPVIAHLRVDSLAVWQMGPGRILTSRLMVKSYLLAGPPLVKEGNG